MESRVPSTGPICLGLQLTKSLPSDEEFCIVPSLHFLRNAIGDSDLVGLFGKLLDLSNLFETPEKRGRIRQRGFEFQ